MEIEQLHLWDSQRDSVDHMLEYQKGRTRMDSKMKIESID